VDQSGDRTVAWGGSLGGREKEKGSEDGEIGGPAAHGTEFKKAPENAD